MAQKKITALIFDMDLTDSLTQECVVQLLLEPEQERNWNLKMGEIHYYILD